MSYSILIAEDDVFISEHLKQILLELEYDVCAIVSSTLQAKEYLNNNEPPDMALLDIQMHGRDQGIEIAKELNKIKVPFIFITSFSDKNTVQAAVKEHPQGYILKPFSVEEIKETVQSVIDSQQEQYLTIKDGGSYRKVLFAEIYYLMSSNVYVEIHTTKGRFVCRQKLSFFQDKLPINKFVKVHRSYIINATFVDGVSKGYADINGTRIPVSKTYQDQLMDHI